MNTNLLSPDAVHPQISSSLTFLVLCVVHLDVFVMHYCLFDLSKELISFIGYLHKCHASVFNAWIKFGIVWENTTQCSSCSLDVQGSTPIINKMIQTGILDVTRG